MRRLWLPAALALAFAASAHAATAPRTLASYCSPSGDVCYGVVKARDGVVRLRISTAARYFARYRLCVRAPGATAARCGSFPIFRSGAVWSSSVRLATFGSRSPGVHRATWSLGSSPLGPTLRFRR